MKPVTITTVSSTAHNDRMLTSLNGNIFRVTCPLCGEFTAHRWIPLTKPVTRSFDVVFYLSLNKQLSQQSRRRWFETTSCSLWRHCNGNTILPIITWLLCFFPGFDRFIPGFDRFIPGFDRFIPASIPVAGTLPLQSKCTLVNKMCIVLYL